MLFFLFLGYVKIASQVIMRISDEKKLDKILKNSGKYFAKINFVIDEEGNFTNFRISGNDVLGRISKEILIKINTEQTTNNTKIIPAKLNGAPVKINYNLPIEYKVN